MPITEKDTAMKMKTRLMPTLMLLTRSVVTLLVVAAATACSGRQEAAAAGRRPATPSAADSAHPGNGLAVRRPSGSRARS